MMRRAAALMLLTAAQLLAAEDTLSTRIDAIGRAVIAHGDVPGLVIGVMRGNDVIFARAYGLADLENDIPVRADTVFPVASVTKTFTAAAILQLVESGGLSLDDDIVKFLPDFPQRGKGVTVRRLLNHTAGIRNITGNPAYWAQAGTRIDPMSLVNFFRDAPLDFEPGTKFAYSNSGYILLGLIVDRASHMPYPE